MHENRLKFVISRRYCKSDQSENDNLDRDLEWEEDNLDSDDSWDLQAGHEVILPA